MEVADEILVDVNSTVLWSSRDRDRFKNKPESVAMSKETATGRPTKKTMVETMIKQAEALDLCIRVADRGLLQCNAVLESLQPRQPGRITLLREHAKSDAETVINEVRWRVVRWRIRSQQASGEVQWEAEHLTLKGAARRTSTKMNFRDTEPQVRAVIMRAVRLIEWRGRLVITGRNFVNGVLSHKRYGLAAASKALAEVDRALEAGNKERAAKRAEVAKIVARQRVRTDEARN